MSYTIAYCIIFIFLIAATISGETTGITLKKIDSTAIRCTINGYDGSKSIAIKTAKGINLGYCRMNNGTAECNSESYLQLQMALKTPTVAVVDATNIVKEVYTCQCGTLTKNLTVTDMKNASRIIHHTTALTLDFMFKYLICYIYITVFQ